MPRRKQVKHQSIRDELERKAWTQNPVLARRLKNRLKQQLQQSNGVSGSTRRIMRWQDRTLLTLAAVLLSLFVIRTETVLADSQVWGLDMQTPTGGYTELAIDTQIQLDITGLVARVEVTQKFNNRSNLWTEGIYRFPLPEGAAVDRLLVKVGKRLLEGEIQEKKTARRIYQQAKAAGQTATIVEQQRRNQFETRLANIGPGEAIEITISYLQNVSYSDFSYRLRIPMTFTPRWEAGDSVTTGRAGITPQLESTANSADHGLQLQANLVTALEFAAIESRYHDVDIRQVNDGYSIELKNTDVQNTDVQTDRDFELSWTPAFATQPTTSLATYNDGESVYAQLMLVPPLADAIESQAREVILIIDTSGSMEGASIVQARAALTHALNSLGPDDYFNLLEFNSETRLLFNDSVAVTQNSIEQAQRFINRLDANGGTDMAPALEMALNMPELPHLLRQVVFVTDGAVGNETELLQMVARYLGKSRMFTIAIGHAPNSWFMRKTAEIGRGSYVHIAKPEEVEKQMSALWERIQIPALIDICIDWGDSAESYPEIIPDLYAGEPLWLLARLPSEPGLIRLCGNLNGLDWEMDINGWDATGGPGGDNLAKLWARKKIEALEDSLMFGADAELIRLETTGLALDFGLLTRHTSLVAVDKTPRRTSNEQLARSEIPGLLPAGSSTDVAGYPNTATGWLAQLLLSLLILLVSTSMLLFSGSRLPMTKYSTTP